MPWIRQLVASLSLQSLGLFPSESTWDLQHWERFPVCQYHSTNAPCSFIHTFIHLFIPSLNHHWHCIIVGTDSTVKYHIKTNISVSIFKFTPSPSIIHGINLTKSGIYQLTGPSCNKKYTGQTGRSFKFHFQEHHRDNKYGNMKSKFA